MSKATKRKHVRREAVEEEVTPTGDQIIVKVTCGRGNNLHEVETCEGTKFLVSMPTKFRKSVWIKRGDYVVVEPIAEGHKVRAEIVYVLYPMQIKSLKEQGEWPAEFSEPRHPHDVKPLSPPTPTTAMLPAMPPLPDHNISHDRSREDRSRSASEESSSSSDSDSSLFQNTNHPRSDHIETSSSEESDY